jgi:hypothetical protein
MSGIFNLDINSYNINELKNILNLQDPFSLEDIINNENLLREKLLMDKSISKEKRKDIIKFLDGVKQKLMTETKKREFKYQQGEYLLNEEHAVMERPGRSVSSHINPVPRDEAAVEGTSKHTIHRLLCLDSRFRNNYYTTLSTNYQVTLPTTVKNVISMELSALEFPSTYFQISKSLGNNYFWIGWANPRAQITTGGGTASLNAPDLLWYYISIPDGNYKRLEIQDAVNEQIQIAIQNNFSATGSDARPICIIDEHTTKTVFTIANGKGTDAATINSSGNGTGGVANSNPWTPLLYVYFNRSSGANNGAATPSTSTEGYTSVGNGIAEPPSVDLAGKNGIVSNLGWILGFRLGEYNGSQSYVSEGCYDAWGTKYIYIVVNDFNKNVNNFVVTAYNESIGKSNVLARISTDSATSSDFSSGLSLTNDTLGQNDAIKKRSYFGPVDISRLQLQILDEFGRVLDLNNMDYSMALNLVCLYD